MIRHSRMGSWLSWKWACRAISLAVVCVLAAVQLPASAQDQKAAADDRPATKVRQQIDQLKADGRSRFNDNWVRHLKALVDEGSPAVPELIAELDATDDDVMLRNLGFILRAIGDKRAVPALIRALPRTCHRPTSDYGAKADDKDLNAFMQKHDIDEKDARGGYSFGRPVREIGGALQKLTGVKQGEEELYFVFLGGSEMQQYAQRSLYQRCASRWADWWESKWKSLVQDPQYAKVNLKAGADEPPVNFPHGPGFRLGEPMNGYIAESDADPKAKFVFLDIDTGRMAPLPEDLRAITDVSHRMDEIQAWAANEGFDLMGTEYAREGEQKSNYFIRALGLTAWEIDTGRWKTLEQEVTLPGPLKMGRPAGGLLVHFDVDRKQFDEKAPASFLFLTREGAHGVLFVGVEVHDTNVKLGERMPANVDMHPVGFKKGRRFAWRLVEPVAPVN